MKEAWQCPGCHTWYAPHIDHCECQKSAQPNTRYVRFVPYPIHPSYPVYPNPYSPYYPTVTWSSSDTNSISVKDVATGTLVLNPDAAQRYYSTPIGDNT